MSKGMTVMFAQDYVEGTVSIICQDTAMYRDFFRDVYGFRPKTNHYVFSSVEEFDSELKRLADEAIEADEREKAREAATYDKWIRGVHALAIHHGISVRDAMRWTLDAEGVQYRYPQDVEYFCYCNGMPLSNGKLILKVMGR